MKLVETTVAGFLGELASASPAPGGGSAAALCGAVAAALCGMVSRLTVGREKYRGSWKDMEEVGRDAETLRERLAGLVDEDAAAFLSVAAARALPRGTEPERDARGKAIADAVLRSARAPLETLKAAVSLAGLSARAVELGNPGCLSDAASAAQAARASAFAAAYNVRVNLPSVADPSLRRRLAAETAEALAAVREIVGGIEQAVEARMEGGSGA